MKKRAGPIDRPTRFERIFSACFELILQPQTFAGLFAHHALMPGRIPDDLHIGLFNTGQGQDAILRIAGNARS